MSVRLQEAQKHPDPDPQHWYSIHHKYSLSVYNYVRQVSVRRAFLGQKMEEEKGSGSGSGPLTNGSGLVFYIS